MDSSERIYLIHQTFQQRHRPVPMRHFLETLGVSRSTVKRDFDYMRDRMQAPIHWDRSQQGYCYQYQQGEPVFDLPGLWFSASEIHALLTMDHLLSIMQPGLLASHIAPLRERIRKLLESGDHSAEAIEERILLQNLATRSVEPEHFQSIVSALLARKRLRVSHYHRGHDSQVSRELSPQRLIYYRNNWYLDAWCHLRNGLRRFGMDAITQPEIIDQPAKEISKTRLQRELSAGYGIFAGRAQQHAVLRFSPKIARWVAHEQWHPDQQGAFDEQGYYRLTLPYSNPTELVMDILRYGADVEVLEPVALRELVVERLEEALAVYRRERGRSGELDG